MPDFDLTEEILHIMATLDKFSPCCRENLLKMVAAWEKDVIELRHQRDEAREIAASLSVYARQCIMDNQRTPSVVQDDIVTRLRGLNAASYHLLCNEAADEIERLRADRDKWKKLAHERNPHSWRNLVRKRYGMEEQPWR